MTQRTLDPSRAGTGAGYIKIKFIGMFVGSALTGVVLVLLAVYNASAELAIVQEIGAMHDMLRDRVAKTAGLRQATSGRDGTRSLAENLSTEEYRVLPVYGGGARAVEPVCGWPGLCVTWERIEASRMNAQGGYFEEGGERVGRGHVPRRGLRDRAAGLEEGAAPGARAARLRAAPRALTGPRSKRPIAIPEQGSRFSVKG